MIGMRVMMTEGVAISSDVPIRVLINIQNAIRSEDFMKCKVFSLIWMTVAISLPCHVGAQTKQGGSEHNYKTRSSISVDPVTVLKPFSAPGRNIAISGIYQSALRDGNDWIQFDPTSPLAKGGLSIITMPVDGQASNVYSALADGYLYLNRGRSIWRKPIKGGEFTEWFTSPRPFHAFQVINQSEVALIWVEDPSDRPLFPYLDVSSEKIKKLNSNFIEIWDANSRTQIRQEAVPSEILLLADTFKLIPIGGIWVFKSEDSMLLYFEVPSLLYNFDFSKKAISRIKTPWQSLDPEWLLAKKNTTPPGFNYYVPGSIFPKNLSVTPIEGGGFRFSYTAMSPDMKTVGTYLATLSNLGTGNSVLLPNLPSEAADGAFSRQFYIAEWVPKSPEVKGLKLRRNFDINKKNDDATEKIITRLIREGARVTGEDEIEPYQEIVVKQRRATTSAPEVPKPEIKSNTLR